MVLTEMAVHQLRSIRAIILQLNKESFIAELPLLDGTSLGKHIRHTLEFHQCLFQEQEVISYDNRKRNAELESSIPMAIATIDSIIQRLYFVQSNKSLKLSVEYAGSTVELTSTWMRELVFLVEHTVHHMAILRIALTAYFPAVTYEPTFGYADATIRFHEQKKVAI